MTDMGLFKNGQKERETFKVITRVDTVDPELKKKTLERMLELKKEQERKAAARRKAVRRGFAVAAIIALVIAVTPLRGYVASAAENVVNAIHSWMEDVFHVGMKKTDNGCTVEIIEARVANDFLYLTVEENVKKVYNEKKGLYPLLYYYGTIYDNEGNSVNFAAGTQNSSFLEADPITVSQEDNSYNKSNLSVYQIYIPGITDVIDSYDKNYSCDLHVCVYQYPDDYYFYTWLIDENLFYNGISPCASMDFKFQIEKLDPVVNDSSKKYNIDYSITVDDIKFDFKKLCINENNSNIVVEIIPLNGYKPKRFWLLPLSVYCTYNGSVTYDQFLEETDDHKICFSSSLGAYDTDALANVSYADGHYYTILNTYEYCNKNLLNLDMPNQFKIAEIGYVDEGDADGNNSNHSYAMTADSIHDEVYAKNFFAELDKTSISTKSLKNKKISESIQYGPLSISFKYLDFEDDKLKLYIDYSIDNILAEPNTWLSFELALESKDKNVRTLYASNNYEIGNSTYIEFSDEELTLDDIMKYDKLIICKIDVVNDTDLEKGKTTKKYSGRRHFYLINPKYYNLEEEKDFYQYDVDRIEAFKKINTFTVGN